MSKNSVNGKEGYHRLFYYGLYTRAIEAIKHFDSIQTYYRMLTSKILLGVFAMSGFVFSAELSLRFLNRFWIVFGACVLGAIIITSLGYIDLIFQERLLISNFREAYDLEEKHKWLPQIHHNMRLEGKHHASSARKSLFYIVSNLTLFILAAVSLFFAEAKSSHILVSCITYIALLTLYYWIFCKQVGDFNKLFDEIALKGEDINGQ